MPGPGSSKVYRRFKPKVTPRSRNQQLRMSKPKKLTERDAPVISKSGKRANISSEENPEVKRRRLAAISGATSDSPDPEPSSEPTVENNVDEPVPVQPKNPAWAQSAWLLDANCDEPTRIALGFQEMYDGSRLLARYSTEYPNQTRILTYAVIHRDDRPEARPGQCQPEYNFNVEAEELWLRWCDHFPEIEDHLDYLADNPALVLIIGKFVSAVAGKVRSDDLGRLNHRIIGLSGIVDSNDILKLKSNRGWNDIRTARFLCPIRYLKKLDADPISFPGHVRNARVKLFTLDYPSLMYDMSLVDPNDAEAGFLRSPYLVKYYKTIMTGKSSAFDVSGGHSKGQRSVASRYELDYVSLHSIVYVALLARSAFTDHDWSDVEGKYWKAQDFLESIMKLAFNSTEWFIDLMAWWNKEIFGHDDALDAETELEMQGSAFHVIMAQRKARKNRAVDEIDIGSEDGVDDGHHGGENGTFEDHFAASETGFGKPAEIDSADKV